jgi:ribosomal protein L27
MTDRKRRPWWKEASRAVGPLPGSGSHRALQSIASVHVRLRAFATAPTPNPALGWARLRPILRDRTAASSHPARRRARRVVAAIAAVLVLTAGVSVAGVPVPRLAAGAWSGIVHLIQGDATEDEAATGTRDRDGPDGDRQGVDGDDEKPQGATGSGRRSEGGDDDTTAPSIANRPPTAVDDQATTIEHSPVTIDVLANDIDPDGDALTVAASQPVDGSVAVEPDGSVTYIPPPDFAGMTTLTYTVSDGSAEPDGATVTVTVEPVNDPPVPKDDDATTDEDTPVAISVLANDIDVDGDELTVDAKQPDAGSVTVKKDGTVKYSPAPDFAGTDAFTYSVSDGTAKPVEAAVTVTVNPVNDSPVAQGDDAATEGSPVTIDVLANDVDPEGDPLSVRAGSAPQHGEIVVNQDGTVTYTPNPGFLGTDTFTYNAFDGSASAEAIVTVLVRPLGDPGDTVGRKLLP